jgi:hypothetical protein
MIVVMILMYSDFSEQNAVSVPKNLILKWNEKIEMECRFGMLRGAACAGGTVAYFNTAGTSNIYCYDYLSKQWTELPAHPGDFMGKFALVVVSDLLTSIGGTNSNKLFTFNGKKWVEKYPPMSTKRSWPAAVCSGHSLVVAGGENERDQSIPTVEVMDTSTLQWSIAASLPRGVYYASMTTCGDDLYLLGDESTHVYSCSLQSLLQSRQAPGKVSVSQQSNVWSRITDLPVLRSTAVTLSGQLISVGGRTDDRHSKAVDSVYCYNPATSTWKIIETIPLSKSLPLVTTLPGDKMIMVYGNQHITIAVASAVVS